MSESVFQALRQAGFNPVPIRSGEAELRINDPDDLAQVHDIVDGFMAEVIQYAGSNRITVREVKT